MPANKRIYYAIQAVGFAPLGSTTYTAVRGLQSVGLNTKFNLEQLFEIGKLAIYQNVENLPDIEMTLEKVLDGHPLLYHLATRGATDGSLVGRSNQRTTSALSIFSDLQSAASGTPIHQCTCSGMYLSSVNYDIKVEGPSMENITLVGNNKVWTTGVPAFTFTGGFTPTGVPLAAEGVNHRWHLVMADCRFPKGIPGIDASGINQPTSDGSYTVHFQSIKVAANLGRDTMLELGRKAPYFRYVNFPVEVKTDFDIMATMGDGINALENASNLGTGDYIYLKMTEGLKIDLGIYNKPTSVNYGGANASSRGGNATTSFSYVTFNDLLVVHPQDPTSALAG